MTSSARSTAKDGARIWFYVEDRTVHLVEVHTHHPHHPHQTK
ncbi:hypothetical protein [Microbacterium indicum]|nr:hypothetical protein [Microbacterium indicum]